MFDSKIKVFLVKQHTWIGVFSITYFNSFSQHNQDEEIFAALGDALGLDENLWAVGDANDCGISFELSDF